MQTYFFTFKLELNIYIKATHQKVKKTAPLRITLDLFYEYTQNISALELDFFEEKKND